MLTFELENDRNEKASERNREEAEEDSKRDERDTGGDREEIGRIKGEIGVLSHKMAGFEAAAAAAASKPCYGSVLDQFAGRRR